LIISNWLLALVILATVTNAHFLLTAEPMEIAEKRLKHLCVLRGLCGKSKVSIVPARGIVAGHACLLKPIDLVTIYLL
jgi:hypothetical protein